MTEESTGPPSMRPERLQSFLGRANVALLAWITTSGEPMATPVWYRYQDGRFLIHSMHPTGKSRSIERSDRVCLCIQDPEPPYRYVTVRGRAKVIKEGERAFRLQEELARAYLGRLGGRYYMRNVVPTFQGEHVTVEITPTSTSGMDGSEGINPLALAAMKVIRKLPGL